MSDTWKSGNFFEFLKHSQETTSRLLGSVTVVRLPKQIIWPQHRVNQMCQLHESLKISVNFLNIAKKPLLAPLGVLRLSAHLNRYNEILVNVNQKCKNMKTWKFRLMITKKNTNQWFFWKEQMIFRKVTGNTRLTKAIKKKQYQTYLENYVIEVVVVMSTSAYDRWH